MYSKGGEMRYLTPSEYPPDHIRGGRIYRINLQPYIERFCKREFQKEVRGVDYKITFAKGIQHGRPPFRDGEYNFILRKVLREEGKRTRRKGIACIGFILEQGAVIVVQIQGVRGEQEILKALRWEQMLLQVVVDWARENKYQRVSVIPSYNLKDNLRYHVTPKKLGFQQGLLMLV